MTEAETNRAVVAKLMAILSGDAPIASGVEFVAPDVMAHVDGWSFQGINVWANWIHYIRTRGRVDAPEVLLDEVVVETDEIVTVRGRWSGQRRGRSTISKLCVARYRVVNGRIVEIWSTRRNYALLCGRHVEYHLGFVLELLRVQRWRARVPQLELTQGTHVELAALRSPALSGGLLAPSE